jgi:hypothetical protein
MPVKPGALLRHQALGTEAVYRVVAVEGGLVHVEVVVAPGLEPGTRVRFTERDAGAMERLRSAPQPDRPAPDRAFRTAE